MLLSEMINELSALLEEHGDGDIYMEKIRDSLDIKSIINIEGELEPVAWNPVENCKPSCLLMYKRLDGFFVGPHFPNSRHTQQGYWVLNGGEKFTDELTRNLIKNNKDYEKILFKLEDRKPWFKSIFKRGL